MNIKDYFKDEENYQNFLLGIKEQFDNITFNGKMKLEAKKPIYFGASTVLKVKYPTPKTTGKYYLKIEIIGYTTLD